jgi:hypothetical protein
MRTWAPILLVACLITVAAGLPLRVRVDRPRLGVPTVLQPGGTLEVHLSTSLPWMAPDLDLSLEGPGGSVPLGPFRRSWHGNVLALTTTLPALADGGYGLRVRTPRQDVHRPGAVFVKAAFPRRYFIVQAGDFPPPGKEDLLPQFIEEMNLIQPVAVLGSGDISYDIRPEWYAFLLQHLSQLEMPFIAAPGNHERKGWAAYLEAFGPGQHRVDVGPLAIFSLDSAHGRDQFTPSEFHWLQRSMHELGDQVPIIQLHHPVFPPGSAVKGEAGGSGGSLQGFQRAFLELCKASRVPLVLSGHWHSDAIFDERGELRDDRPDFPGTHFAVVTALGNELRQVTRWPHKYHGYRVIQFDGGKLLGETYDLGGTGHPSPVASVPLGNLHVATQADGSVNVRNDLNEAFPGAVVTLTHLRSDLQPDHGLLLKVRPQGSGFQYRVNLPLPAHSNQTVRLEARP